MILTAHLDTTNSKKYNEHALRLKIIQDLSQTLYFRVIIPSIIMIFVIYRIVKALHINPAQWKGLRILIILFAINIMVSLIY